jgi:FkbM family methyltransferase
LARKLLTLEIPDQKISVNRRKILISVQKNMHTNPIMSDFDAYVSYLCRANPDFDLANLGPVEKIFEQTNWQTPNSPIDCNNLAVMALVQAEQCTCLRDRQALMEQATALLKQGESHPLCAAHLKLVATLLWQMEDLGSLTFTKLLETLQKFALGTEFPTGLIYLPSPDIAQSKRSGDLLEPLFAPQSGQEQALLLLSEVICRANLCFYNDLGLRALQIQSQFFPRTPRILLKLGIAHWLNGQPDGLVCFHRAQQLAPGDAAILQTLHLIYCTMRHADQAAEWQQQGLRHSLGSSGASEWAWTQLPPEQTFTYLPFETDILLATERSLSSIVTSVLLAEGDWFEKEMELWRNHIQPGMVVIDVGANAGVYTFSAAKRVGSQGRVIAVEPFAGCVHCLRETCRVNEFTWVTVYPGAASDRTGTLNMRIGRTSELNTVLPADAAVGSDVSEVACITLDDLVAQEQLTRVDVIKLDAERHEIPVLQGCERLLQDFRPIILYENSGVEVAEFLSARGYTIYYYQPYLQNLVQLQPADARSQSELNLIALPNPPI